METCVFCRIVAGRIPASVVYQDEQTIAFMDIGSVNPGHMLVAVKAHVENVFGLDDELAAAAMRTTARMARAIKRAIAPEGVNLFRRTARRPIRPSSTSTSTSCRAGSATG